MRCGVPQGSILGPLLYLLYVTDISKSCRGNISYADDTTLYMSNSNLNELFLEANSTINELFQWFCANRLSLNPTKTKYTIIYLDHSNNNATSGLNVSINNTVIQRVGNDCEEKATKFLGIYRDENPTWRHHIANVNKRFYFIAKGLPQSFDNMFIFKRDIPGSRITRQSDHLFEVRYRTNFVSRLPLFNIPRIWNKWFHTPLNILRSQFNKLTSRVWGPPPP